MGENAAANTQKKIIKGARVTLQSQASLGVDAIAVGVEINLRLCVRTLIKKASRPPINAQSARLKWHTPSVFILKPAAKWPYARCIRIWCRSSCSFIHLRAGSLAYSIRRLCGIWFAAFSSKRRTTFAPLWEEMWLCAICSGQRVVLSAQWMGMHYEYICPRLFSWRHKREALSKNYSVGAPLSNWFYHLKYPVGL